MAEKKERSLSPLSPTKLVHAGPCAQGGQTGRLVKGARERFRCLHLCLGCRVCTAWIEYGHALHSYGS
jgi:hypothetical protein